MSIDYIDVYIGIVAGFVFLALRVAFVIRRRRRRSKLGTSMHLLEGPYRPVRRGRP